MASLTFLDTCFPFPLRTRVMRDAVATDRTQAFAAAREIYERPKRVIDWSGEVAPGYADYIETLYDQTRGGIFNLDYTAPDTGDNFEVCFARQPSVEKNKTANGKVSISFELEEVL